MERRNFIKITSAVSAGILVLYDEGKLSLSDPVSKYLPGFANAGGTSAVDYIPSFDQLIGANGTGVSTDYAGAIRAALPIIGAFENHSSLGSSVEVWKSGSMEATYGNLSSAFDALNSGIIVEILYIY